MLSLIQFNLPVLAVALLIGIVTGRWLFRRRPSSSGSDSEAP
jgi:hypothetical protein